MDVNDLAQLIITFFTGLILGCAICEFGGTATDLAKKKREGRIVSEKFGIPEMREFAMAHGDQRVYLIWLRLNEARTKNALWCSETVKLRAEVDRLRESARWRKWPEEVPEKTGYYTIHLVHMKYPVTIWFSVHSGWDVKYNSCWWIKLEMPKTETGGVGDGHIRNA